MGYDDGSDSNRLDIDRYDIFSHILNSKLAQLSESKLRQKKKKKEQAEDADATIGIKGPIKYLIQKSIDQRAERKRLQKEHAESMKVLREKLSGKYETRNKVLSDF